MWSCKQEITHNLCCNVSGNILRHSPDTNQVFIEYPWNEAQSTRNTGRNRATLQVYSIRFGTTSIQSVIQKEILEIKQSKHNTKSLPESHCTPKVSEMSSDNFPKILKATSVPIKINCMPQPTTPSKTNSFQSNKRILHLFKPNVVSQCSEAEKMTCCNQIWFSEHKTVELYQKLFWFEMEVQQNLPNVCVYDPKDKKHAESFLESKRLMSMRHKSVLKVQNLVSTKCNKTSSCGKSFDNFQNDENLHSCYLQTNTKWIIADCATKESKTGLHFLFETNPVSIFTYDKLRLKRSVEISADQFPVQVSPKATPVLCKAYEMEGYTGYAKSEALLALCQVYIHTIHGSGNRENCGSDGVLRGNDAKVVGSTHVRKCLLALRPWPEHRLYSRFCCPEFSTRSQITWDSGCQNFILFWNPDATYVRSYLT